MLKDINRSHFYAFAAVFIWAFAYVGTRAVISEIGAPELGFMRNFVAAVFFVALIAVQKLGLPPLRDWPIFLLSGLLGYALYLLLFNKGMETLNAATSCVLVGTGPLLTALIASFIFKEKLRFGAWVSMAVAFAGVAVLAFWEGSLTIDIGIVWTVLAVVGASSYNIIQRYLAKRGPGAKVYTSVQMAAYSFFGAVLLSVYFAPSSIRQFAALNLSHQGVVVLMGIFPSALSYLLWAKALRLTANTSSVVNYLFLTPFITLVLAYFIIDELPNAGAYYGGGLILLGLFLFSLSMRRGAPRLVQKSITKI